MANLTLSGQVAWAGYIGAAVLMCWLPLDVYFQFNLHLTGWFALPPLLFPVVLVTYVMLVVEFGRRRSRSPHSVYAYPWRWRSAVVRYTVVLAAVSVPTLVVHEHYYFLKPAFTFTREFYFSLWGMVLLFGLPYMLLVLRAYGAKAYDFNDFSIILLAALRVLRRWGVAVIFRQGENHGFGRLKNWRIKKIVLVYLANFFFLTLMTRFFSQEWATASRYWGNLVTPEFYGAVFFGQYEAVYHTLFHTLFVVDTGLAIVAYAISTRWLNNRAKSIDFTLLGWLAALACYPPFNSAMSEFIGYGFFDTTSTVTSEWARAVLMALTLLCLSVYVWATMALGLKFGNLVNRGIVTDGPYKWSRHPAYFSKNVSWWLENPQVFSNLGAVLALGAWNAVYVLRAITEERHLQRDSVYRQYQGITRRWLGKRV